MLMISLEKGSRSRHLVKIYFVAVHAMGAGQIFANTRFPRVNTQVHGPDYRCWVNFDFIAPAGQNVGSN